MDLVRGLIKDLQKKVKTSILQVNKTTKDNENSSFEFNAGIKDDCTEEYTYDTKIVKRLLTDFHVLINVEYGIAITSDNLLEKYNETEQIIERTVNAILKVGSQFKSDDVNNIRPSSIEQQAIMLLILK